MPFPYFGAAMRPENNHTQSQPLLPKGGSYPLIPQHVKVDVEIQRTAEGQDQDDSADAGGLSAEPGLPDEMLGNDASDDAQHRAHYFGAAGEQEAQRIGTLNTQWRTGCSGKTSPTCSAALSAMRWAPKLGQNPRRLQLKATRGSA